VRQYVPKKQEKWGMKKWYLADLVKLYTPQLLVPSFKGHLKTLKTPNIKVIPISSSTCVHLEVSLNSRNLTHAIKNAFQKKLNWCKALKEII
jgi:hypothetical protein